MSINRNILKSVLSMLKSAGYCVEWSDESTLSRDPSPLSD
jgi:hypothetical protein